MAAYRAVAGDLRLSYSQFQELEAFSRFGTRLDERSRQLLERGYRVRQVLQQPPYDPLPVAQQIIVLLAVTQGLFDAIHVERLAVVEKELRRLVCDRLPDLCRTIAAGADLSEADRTALVQQIQTILPTLTANTHGNH